MKRRYVCSGCGRPHKPCVRCAHCPGGVTTTTRQARRAILDTLAAIEDPRIDDAVPLVHGRVVIAGSGTFFADVADDRNQLVARIGYRLRDGWKPQPPKKVEPRRPWDGWAEDAAWT
jgi:hypothetical protein